MQTRPRARARERGGAQPCRSGRADTICGAVAEARECTAGMSRFLLTQPSADKPTWGCESYRYPSAQSCSEGRALRLGGNPHSPSNNSLEIVVCSQAEDRRLHALLIYLSAAGMMRPRSWRAPSVAVPGPHLVDPWLPAASPQPHVRVTILAPQACMHPLPAPSLHYSSTLLQPSAPLR